MNGGMKNLDDIPEPKPTIGCQDLLTLKETHKHGLLRKRSGFAGWMLKKFEPIAKAVKWGHVMVVVSGGCIYVYKSEQDKKPCTAFSLYGYNKVEAEKESKEVGGNKWVFKIMPVQTKQHTYYFACTSETELKKWMHAVRGEMKVAHSIQDFDDSFSMCSDTSLSKLEEPIYDSTTELRSPPPVPLITDEEGDESSLPDYNEIDPTNMNPLGRDWNKANTAPSVLDRPLPIIPPPLGAKDNSISGMPIRRPPSPPASDLGKRRPPPLPKDDSGSSEEAISERERPPVGGVQALKESMGKPTLPKKPIGGISIMPGMLNLSSVTLKSPTTKSSPKGIPDTPPRPDRQGGTTADSSTLPKVEPPKHSKKQVPPIPKGRGSTHSGGSAASLPYSAPNESNDQALYEVAKDEQNVLEPEDYFSRAKFNDPDKNKSSTVIKELGVEGAFLIRPGNAGTEQVLVVYAENDARKYKLNNDGGQYYINSDLRFDDLNKLIVYYMQNNLPKRTTRLNKPYQDLR